VSKKPSNGIQSHLPEIKATCVRTVTTIIILKCLTKERCQLQASAAEKQLQTEHIQGRKR
jgi:hypothetical protein